MYSYHCHFYPAVVSLRPINGLVEQTVTNTSTRTVLALLDELLEATSTDIELKDFNLLLSTAERDRLLAELHIQYFGDEVVAYPFCSLCDEKYEVRFSLTKFKETSNNDFQSKFDEYVEADQLLDNGTCVFELKSGDCIRLINGSDEINLERTSKELAEKYLLENCILEHRSDLPEERLLSLLDDLNPVLDETIQTECANCSGEQQLQFSIQAYFLEKIMANQPSLNSDIHLIASQYQWSFSEILKLSTVQRHNFVELIVSERG